MEEPKVKTKETRDNLEQVRDTPSEINSPSQQGLVQQGLVEEEPAFHLDPD
jgi:hypothetical protein